MASALAGIRVLDLATFLAAPVCATLLPGVVPRLTVTPGEIRAPGPLRPGEHNEEISCGRLGLSTAELRRLAERGVV